MTSPVEVSAAARSTPTATLIQIYLDGKKVFETHASSLDTSVTMSTGTHRLTVQAFNGTWFKKTEFITVMTGATTAQLLYATQPSWSGGGTSPIFGFRVNSDGSLTSLGTALQTSNQFVVIADATGHHLFGFDIGSTHGSPGLLATFAVQPDTGALQQTSSVPLPPNTSFAPAMTLNPAGTFLFVQNVGVIATYSVDTAGNLTLVHTADLGFSGIPIVPAVNPTGTFLYAASTSSLDATTTVEQFAIDSSGGLTPVSSLAVGQVGSPANLAITPNGNTLYLGTIDTVGGAGIVEHVLPGVLTFSVDPSTGNLTKGATVSCMCDNGLPDGGGPIAVNAKGTLLFQLTQGEAIGAGGVALYAIDQSTGALTPLPNSFIGLGNPGSESFVLSSSGTSLYATGCFPPSNLPCGNLQIKGFFVSDNGAVTLVPGSPASTTGFGGLTLTIVNFALTSTGVTVSISPTSATVATGGTQQFTDTVTGSSDTSVTWSVDGITGGNATVGTISTGGLYTAPGSAGSHTVTVTSNADSTKSASATVTVTSGVNVSISPTSATVATGGTQQFTDTVTGSSDTSVTWSVDGVTGGNATIGTISTGGLYTAPGSAGSHTVTVTSNADSTKSASAQVIVTTISGGPCKPTGGQPSVTICKPGASVQSPVEVSAAANSSPTATLIQIYLDGKKVFEAHASSLDPVLNMSNGTHRLTVQAFNGAWFKKTEFITVTSEVTTAQLLYAGNPSWSGGGTSPIFGSRVNSDGSLTSLDTALQTSNQFVVLADVTGHHLFGFDIGSTQGSPGLLATFAVQPDTGALQQTSSVALPPNNLNVAPAMTLSPAGTFLFVHLYSAGVIATYSVDAAGNLTLVHTANVGFSAAPIGPVVNPAGTFLYAAIVSSLGDTTLEQFAIDSSGGLTPVSSLALGLVGGPANLAITPNGNTLYLGTFTAPAGSPEVLTFSVDPSTGKLTKGATVSCNCDNGLPEGGGLIAVNAKGTLLFEATHDQSTAAGGVALYAIDQSTGALTPLPNSFIGLGNPGSISFVLDGGSSGTSLYATGCSPASALPCGNAQIQGFFVSDNGAVTSVPGSPGSTQPFGELTLTIVNFKELSAQ